MGNSATSSSDVRAILLGARELIADPARWCAGTFARRADGAAVALDSPEATRWCAIGALYYSSSTNSKFGETAHRLAGTAARATGFRSLGAANDIGGHACALAVLDAAVASLAELRHD